MKTYEITQDQLNKLANDLAVFPYGQIYKVFELLRTLKPVQAPKVEETQEKAEAA